MRRLAWLTVYPTSLKGQQLPVLPLVQVLTDALERVGEVAFTQLRVRAPLALAHDADFDLRTAADWFALAAPHARTPVTVTVTADTPVDAARLCRASVRGGHGLLHLQRTTRPAGEAAVLEGSSPEWTPQAAAWITEVVIQALRANGSGERAEITVLGA